jgi:predicted RNA-binding Zn-ribbon protein involved in translation (DUF1610 family)
MKPTFSILRICDNAVEANIIKEKLVAEDIPSFVGDEHLLTMNPFYSLAAGGIKVYVKPEDLEKASAVLDLTYAEYKYQLKCPTCASPNIEFGRKRKDPKNIFALLVSVFFGVFPFYNKKVYHCNNCGFEADHLEE